MFSLSVHGWVQDPRWDRTIQTAQKTKEGSQIRSLEQVVHVRVEIQRRVPLFQKVRKAAEIPHVPFFKSLSDFSVNGEDPR